MPKWTEYTSKDTLADNDEVMLYDATGKANKRGLMSKFWDYVVDKMATAVISKLETENKTVIGALNYLNGKTKTLIPKITAGSEEELCKKIADVIIKNPANTTLCVSWVNHFSVCVNVYYDRNEYFIYTVQIFESLNRYICEYYKGTISIKK